MKIYNKEESENLVILGKGRHTQVYVFLARLHVGEVLFIEKGKDWVTKSPPYRIVKFYEQKTGRKFEKGRSPDGKGWLIRRVV